MIAALVCATRVIVHYRNARTDQINNGSLQCVQSIVILSYYML